ncbi:hypothetical protein N0V90_007703 [Kalmusia sp. IMI 367209]|nr:hypothetical protein N0V90_007703 [Kalmusia sp. IMI 367209]
MASPHRAQKKRPPPIEIPAPYTLRSVVPGPNAFAIAERKAQEKEAEDRRRAENDAAQFRPHTSGHDAPQASNVVVESSSSLPRAHSTNLKLPGKETISHFMDQVRNSPRKSDHSCSSSSATSRHGSKTRSKYFERSYNSAVSGQRHLEGLSEETTLRGEIEAQNERKLFKLMGEVPDTPKTDNHVKINDFRLGRRGSESTKASDRETVTRSPKKKLFGVSIPFSRNSTNKEPPPPMPRKVAKVLGSSPPGKQRKFSPLRNAGVIVPRSDTSKSLPSKLFYQTGHHGRRRSPIHEGTSRVRPSRRSPTTKATPFSHAKTLEALTAADEAEIPPTPPRKDSLLFNYRQIETLRVVNPSRTVSQLLRPPRTPAMEPDDFKDNGMKLVVPPVPNLDPIPSTGGRSPSKYCPKSAADEAELVEGNKISSAYGEVEYIDDEEDVDLFTTPRPKRRSAGLGLPPSTPLTARLKGHVPQPEAAPPSSVYSPQLEFLPSTVYSPPTTVTLAAGGESSSKTDNLLLPADRPKSEDCDSKRESIPVVFRGDVSDIDSRSVTEKSASSSSATTRAAFSKARNDGGGSTLNARVMEELQLTPLRDLSRQASSKSTLQPEHSASQLSDMLNGVSPSRADFHDFPPNGSSAGHPMFAGTTFPLPPRSGMPIHDHFFMTNEHIDVVAISLYDWVQSRSEQQTNVASSKHEQLKTAVEQRFEDLKSQINSVSDKIDHNDNQNHNISVQLDKLRDFIKTDIVDPFAKQMQKMGGLELGMKELQKAVQDLQNSGAQNHAPLAGYPSPGQRSQPSLVGFYENNSNATNSTISQMAPSGPSESRRYGINNQLGRSGYGRDTRENNYAFTSANPYHSPGGSFNNGLVGGGYQQPYNYSTMQDQQSYGYNGVSK